MKTDKSGAYDAALVVCLNLGNVDKSFQKNNFLYCIILSWN